MKRINVAIFDNNLAWLKDMESFINNHDDMIVVATAESTCIAWELAKSKELDVVLIDINMRKNDCDGIHFTVHMVDSFPEIKIIILTASKNEDMVRCAFTAGASNYIVKSEYLYLPQIIRECYNKFNPMDIVLKEYSDLKREEVLKVLTASEREIYDLLEEGCTKLEIESILYKTKNTIKCQIHNILKKMDCSSVKSVMQKVRSKGLLK